MSTPTTKITAHVLALPLPVQGHVLPMLEAMQCLGSHGIKVTFVNSEVNHNKVSSGRHNIGDHIDLVSVPDGMEPWEDRTDFVKWTQAIMQVMPEKVEELILKTNASENGNKVTCVVSDFCFPWSFRLAKKLGLRCVMFFPISGTQVGLSLAIPKLLQDGIVDKNGTPQKKEMVQLSPNMPAIPPSLFFWQCYLDSPTNRLAFNILSQLLNDLEVADHIVCNSTYELEPATFDLYPNITPIGPLLAQNRQGVTAGYFWKEDSTCLEWLDQQAPNSVLYVAFGSHAIFNKIQFQEWALGLEMSKHPFLWVVRPDMIDKNDDAFTQGFKDRVGNRGRIISWAPQQRVLSHPSLACFFTHCGWGSVLEGLSNGVPFLGLPYFADQPQILYFISEVWEVGLGFKRDALGIVTKEEIQEKVEKLLGDTAFKKRAMELKDVIAKSVSEGGISNKNFNNFANWLKS